MIIANGGPATTIHGRDVALIAVLREVAKAIANPHPFPMLAGLTGESATPALDKAIDELERAVTNQEHR